MIDLRRAYELSWAACDGGSGMGCTGVDWSYQLSQGVARDSSRAAQFFGKGCDMGHAQGCQELGVLVLEGSGVPADGKRAVALFVKACAGDEALGCSAGAPGRDSALLGIGAVEVQCAKAESPSLAGFLMGGWNESLFSVRRGATRLGGTVDASRTRAKLSAIAQPACSAMARGLPQLSSSSSQSE